MNDINIACCRICRESTCPDKVTIEFDSVWARLYESCFGLQVNQYGPQTFCKSCSDKLNDYEQFKQLCLQSEEMWKSLAQTTICSPDKLIEEEENLESFDEVDWKENNDDNICISDEDFTLTYENEDEKIEECVNNDKDNLGSKCVDIIEKPLDLNGGGYLPVTHGIKNENINDFISNLKDKLGGTCINKIKKPHDKKRAGAFPVTHGIKDEKINEYVENLKDKLGEICIKIKKPTDEGKQMTNLDNKCQKRINSSTEPNRSKYSVKKYVLVNSYKGMFGEICIDKMKNVLDKDTQVSGLDNKCQNRQNNSSTGTNHSVCAVKKEKLTITNETKLPKTSQIVQKSLGSSKRKRNRKQAPKEFYCGICEYSSTSSSDVDQHFVKHCEDTDFHCKLCSFEGKDAADMLLHRYTHQKDQKPRFKCHLCPKKFLKVKNLPIHYRSEHLKLKCDCQFCGKSLNYMQLKKHEKRHIFPKYKCHECGSGFLSRGALRKHMLTHNIENQYICEQCGRRFKTLNDVKKHKIYKHTETEPETCSICGRQFKNKLTLKAHIRKKHGEKKFLCDVCSTGFCTEITLRHHIFIHHSDEKPFPCDHCDSKYRSLKMLKAHQQSQHSGELVYMCAECGNRFSSRTACKRHQLSGCQIP